MSNGKYDTDGMIGTVEAKVRSVVEGMGEGVAYLFCDWARANVAIDRIDGPTVVYVLPPSGDLHFSWREVKDCPQSQICFLAPTDFDFEGDENDCIVEQMKRLCMRFVRALNASGLFAQIDGRVPYKVLYDHLDANVTGIVITPTLEEEDGVTVCDDIMRVDPDAEMPDPGIAPDFDVAQNE